MHFCKHRIEGKEGGGHRSQVAELGLILASRTKNWITKFINASLCSAKAIENVNFDGHDILLHVLRIKPRDNY